MTTMPKEMQETDTGNEGHVQDGEEHVASNSNSMTVSEIIGAAGIEKMGEELEEELHPSAIEAPAGASYLHPLVLQDSESDSEDQPWTTHPSSSPEVSLLRAAYFQLLDAGFDGETVRELFRSRFRIWRKAYEKPVETPTEPEMEFEEVHHMQVPPRVGNHDDDTNGEQLQQQMPSESLSKRDHVEARKTAANVGSFKFRGQICTRTTHPLPPHIGVRRKTLVKKKKKKGYLKNRLQ